ncbi:MAG: hypothetical protein LBO69_06060 [Ignavibacteria bacterium]|jgi:hypothetical protein|nr:hypothetical protein [Ignavibacteria bacterium]
MKANNDNELILQAIQDLDKKVDTIAAHTHSHCSDNRLDGEIVAVLTAACCNLFGRRIALRKVRVMDENPHSNRHFRQVAVRL